MNSLSLSNLADQYESKSRPKNKQEVISCIEKSKLFNLARDSRYKTIFDHFLSWHFMIFETSELMAKFYEKLKSVSPIQQKRKILGLAYEFIRNEQVPFNGLKKSQKIVKLIQNEKDLIIIIEPDQNHPSLLKKSIHLTRLAFNKIAGQNSLKAQTPESKFKQEIDQFVLAYLQRIGKYQVDRHLHFEKKRERLFPFEVSEHPYRIQSLIKKFTQLKGGRFLDQGLSIDQLTQDMMLVSSIDQSSDFNFINRGLKALSQDIKLIQIHLCQALTARDFEKKERLESSLSRHKFSQIAAYFNRLSKWVIKDVLNGKTVKERMNILFFYHLLVKALVDIHDYQSANALLTGLNHYILNKLEVTKDIFKDIYACILDNLQEINLLIQPDDSYASWRRKLESLKKTKTSFVPLLPFILSHLDHSNEIKIVKNGMINLNLISDFINLIQPILNLSSIKIEKLKLRTDLIQELEQIHLTEEEETEFYELSTSKSAEESNRSSLAL